MKTLAIAALLPTLLLAAGAEVAERRFPVAPFDRIETASSDRVTVRVGAAPSVTATGDPAILPSLLIVSEGGRLRITRRPGRYHDRGVDIAVTVPRLTAATVNGSNSFAATGIAGPAFALSANGSSDVRLEDLRVARATLNVAGSGDVAVTGRAPQATIAVAGSGSIDATRLGVRDLDASVYGSGAIVAAATGTATLRAFGSGSVRVSGTRDCRIERHGSGSASCSHSS